ncbi:hypothetical protein HDK90DRAFT_242867 [Phyllosticta capitalensis]|uniref:Uncharacterized protein n=1 Tax=Phyllosticta capitalensis TaxID=121624 RepID=A0ABR1YPI5_9PEZI
MTTGSIQAPLPWNWHFATRCGDCCRIPLFELAKPTYASSSFSPHVAALCPHHIDINVTIRVHSDLLTVNIYAPSAPTDSIPPSRIHIHASLLLLLLLLDRRLHALQKCLDSITTSQRDATSADKAAIVDLDPERLADARQAAVAQRHGEALQALLQLRRVQDALEDVELLAAAERLDGRLHRLGVGFGVGRVGFLGQQEDLRREVGQERVDEGGGRAFDDGDRG